MAGYIWQWIIFHYLYDFTYVSVYVDVGSWYLTEVLEEHLREIRTLRQRLEKSINTNDRLRQQLEWKLKQNPTDHGEEFAIAASLNLQQRLW